MNFKASLLVVICSVSIANAQIFKSAEKKGHISFHSYTPMENIDAKTEGANSIINTMNDSVMVKISMVSFVFPKPLMQEHFNENYVESEKFPFASFRGKLNQKVNFTADGLTKVTCTGNMNLHGVTKPVTLEGTINVKGEEVVLLSDFKVKLVDYNIQVPKLVMQNIAEEIEVKTNITYHPFVKKK